MNTIRTDQNRKNKLIFWVIPALLLILILLIRIETSKFFYSWFDPTYAYLFNGLTFASGSIDIGHTDHPGTPLQLLCALVITLMKLFRPGTDLTADVLSHAELYIEATVGVLIALALITLYGLGIQVWRATRKKELALMIQLAPLLSLKSIFFMPVLTTESLLFSLTLAIAILLVPLITGSKPLSGRWLAALAGLSGTLLAVKISSLPVLLLPFILLPDWRKRSWFAAGTLLTALIWVAPVLPHLDRFFGFITSLFTHTGRYGTGEARLFDSAQYLAAWREMLTRELPFTLHLIGLLAALLVLIIKKPRKPVLRRLLAGLISATVLTMIVVARQYSFHYLNPLYSLALPLHLLFWTGLAGTFSIKRPAGLKPGLVAAVLLLVVFSRLVVQYHFFPGLKNPVAETAEVLATRFSGPVIVFADGHNGCALPQPAFHFGLAYTGLSRRDRCSSVLDSLYPGTLLAGTNDLQDWNGPVLPQAPFARHPGLYLYSRSATTAEAYDRISKMVETSGLLPFTRLERVYEAGLSGEVIVLAHTDTAALAPAMRPDQVITVDLEHFSPDSSCFYDNSELLRFGGSTLRSRTTSHSGQFSLLLTNDQPYGLQHEFKVKAGERFRLSVRQTGTGSQLAHLIATAPNCEQFYRGSARKDIRPGIWQSSELQVNLPATYSDSILKIFVYFPGQGKVWIDDLTIERYPPMETLRASH